MFHSASIDSVKAMWRQYMRQLLRSLPDRPQQDAALQEQLEYFRKKIHPQSGRYWGVFQPLPLEPQVQGVWTRWQQAGLLLAYATVWSKQLVWTTQPPLKGWRWDHSPEAEYCVSGDRLQVIFCPGLAFDEFGCRLGQGGGFYDRWLAQGYSVIKVGVIYRQQWTRGVPCCSHDAKMDVMITPDGIWFL